VRCSAVYPWTPNVATRGVLTHLENTKSHFRPGLRPGPRRGSSRRSPRPRSRLGRGIPPPHSPPLDAFGVSILGAYGASQLDAFGVSEPRSHVPLHLYRVPPKRILLATRLLSPITHGSSSSSPSSLSTLASSLTEVTAAVNKLAPLRRCYSRPSKHVTRCVVVAGRHQRRKLERVWKRSGHETDQVMVYRRSCYRANKLINASRFKFFHDELESAADCKER